MKLVILYRDGTINYDSDDHIRSPNDWRPIEGSLEAIARFTQAGYGLEASKDRRACDRHPCTAQAAGDPASYASCTAREANADHRSLDALSAGGNAPVMTSRRPWPSWAAAVPRPAAAT